MNLITPTIFTLLFVHRSLNKETGNTVDFCKVLKHLNHVFSYLNQLPQTSTHQERRRSAFIHVTGENGSIDNTASNAIDALLQLIYSVLCDSRYSGYVLFRLNRRWVGILVTSCSGETSSGSVFWLRPVQVKPSPGRYSGYVLFR